MVFTFYKARGLSVGKSLVEEDKLELARQLEEKARQKGVQLLLPTDVVLADNFAPDANSQIAKINEIPEGWMGLDIGPDSIRLFQEALVTCKTVIWNGPMGVFENDAYSNGTRSIAENLSNIAKNGVSVIAGGGDTSSALRHFNLTEKLTHVSTGGGSTFKLMSGNNLIALERLEV